eukprot:1178967-Rhodomonas_salina.4
MQASRMLAVRPTHAFSGYAVCVSLRAASSQTRTAAFLVHAARRSPPLVFDFARVVATCWVSAVAMALGQISGVATGRVLVVVICRV